MKRIFLPLCLLFIFQISTPMERAWRLFSQFKNYVQQKSERNRQELLKGYISHTQLRQQPQKHPTLTNKTNTSALTEKDNSYLLWLTNF